ncbi:aromatic ring-hydroxylating oxygenase subunit alpha [Phytohabitans suffuscus]|uniref:(2Fe-2S)-binding protein n=1 Tax=Phytohabitans suffuscus TaxID=624315 RepID=A0A6F8YRF6_9ACTN|nr:aromatic ring-hydroxylating dioxygenase subunit alpha [Phytohabitans suffuscus]BCB88573.1 (2Fe-2S)-binding protein [Phytohabitans suffuscus]
MTIEIEQDRMELLKYQAPAFDPGTFYQHVLDTDTREVPETLRRQNPLTQRTEDVPVETYFSPEVHQQEVERIWKRAWQMACREEEIPEVGDTLVYNIATLSFIVARVAPDVIKAYPNACLHRGRKLVDEATCATRLREFKCAFHGFTWNLEGDLALVPAAWDFPDLDPEGWHLPEVVVGRWGGFVFINPDPGAEPFEDYIGDLPDHFRRAPLEDRYIAAHVAKIVPCNWKAAQEAFMESFHVITTHPQLLPQSSNFDAQYDAWGNYSRAISPNFLPSAFLSWFPTDQEIMDASVDRRLDVEPAVVVPEGVSAREHGAHMAREAVRKVIGDEADKFCDAEMADSFYFTLFPNIHPWAAFNRLTFRFRPNGNDPNTAIQDVYILSPFSGERPPAAKVHWLTAEEDFTAGFEIGGYLARILNQDLFNMPKVQEGLKATQKQTVTFSKYQESKIRHFYTLYDAWLSEDAGVFSAPR